MKQSKLTIEKFRILELTNPSNVKGGTNGNTTIDTMGSDNTTYTTDPNVQCPITTAAITTTAGSATGGSNTVGSGNSGGTIDDDKTTRSPTSGTNVPTLGNICL